MRLSKLIKELSDDLEKFGDKHIKSFRVEDLQGIYEYKMLSMTRKDKYGYKAIMNLKEFKEYCESKSILENKEK